MEVDDDEAGMPTQAMLFHSESFDLITILGNSEILIEQIVSILISYVYYHICGIFNYVNKIRRCRAPNYVKYVRKCMLYSKSFVMKYYAFFKDPECFNYCSKLICTEINLHKGVLCW